MLTVTLAMAMLVGDPCTVVANGDFDAGIGKWQVDVARSVGRSDRADRRIGHEIIGATKEIVAVETIHPFCGETRSGGGIDHPRRHRDAIRSWKDLAADHGRQSEFTGG